MLSEGRSPQPFREPAAIRAYMEELRAYREAFIETVVSMISAQDAFVQQYLDGRLSVSEPPAAAIPMVPSYLDTYQDELRFTSQQALLESQINRRVDQALRIRVAEDDVEYERLVGLAEEQAESLGARVLIALPTGVQRSRMRQRHPNADLGTCHGAFLFHRPLVESLGIMAAYDLIVIDEAFQLVEDDFARLHEMWLAAAKAPCLVMAGDEWQLPPPDREQRNLACHPKWRYMCPRWSCITSGDRKMVIPFLAS